MALSTAVDTLLDVDGGQVAEHEGARELLLRVVVLAREHHHRERGRDALVAASGIAHHRNHRPGHTGVASA